MIRFSGLWGFDFRGFRVQGFGVFTDRGLEFLLVVVVMSPKP